ncbi:cytochrome P450 [Streptosporangium sp. CA-135522]|uniref:cytochrome P450 n=1 Tax=Streptosporangium sp. CA-135522 TaxID=3240072 RepID=UPI003D8DDBB0
MLYNPFDHALQENPYPTYARLRDEAPLHHNEDLDFWALSRHADVNAAFRDPALFSSAHGVTLEMWDPNASALVGFLAMDPPRHTRMRALVSRGFTPTRVAGLEPAVRAVARQVLAPALEAGTFDFAEVVSAIPVHVVSELLGVPREDRAEMLRLSEIIITRYDGDTGIPQAFWDAAVTLTAAYTELIAGRRARPRDDLVSALVLADIDGDRLSDEEIVAVLSLIGVAGNESVTKLAANAWYQAWLHPDQRAIAWRGAIAAWVEETLRYDGSAQMVARRLTRDTVLHGTAVPAGARMVLLGASANRDPRVFPHADRYDLGRDTAQALAFGSGPHFCLGAALARLQLRVVLEELVAVVDDYDIDETGIAFVHSPNLRGFRALPTTVKRR